MSTIEVSPVSPALGEPKKLVVNDFSIQVATVNGSGSQTANNVAAITKMNHGKCARLIMRIA